MEGLTRAAIGQHSVFKFLDDAGFHSVPLHDCYPLPFVFRAKGEKEDDDGEIRYYRGNIVCRSPGGTFNSYRPGNEMTFYVANDITALKCKSDLGMSGGQSIYQILKITPCVSFRFDHKFQATRTSFRLIIKGSAEHQSLKNVEGEESWYEKDELLEQFVKVIADFKTKKEKIRFTLMEILAEERTGLHLTIRLEEENLMGLARARIFAYFHPHHIITQSPEDIHIYHPPTGKGFSMQLKSRSTIPVGNLIEDLWIDVGNPMTLGVYVPDCLFITLDNNRIVILDTHCMLKKVRTQGRFIRQFRLAELFNEDGNEIGEKIPDSEVECAQLFFNRTLHLHRECTPLEIEYMEFAGVDVTNAARTSSIHKVEGLSRTNIGEDKTIENTIANYIKEKYILGPANDNGHLEDSKYIPLIEFHKDFIEQHKPGDGYDIHYTRYLLFRKIGLLVTTAEDKRDDKIGAFIYGISKKPTA